MKTLIIIVVINSLGIWIYIEYSSIDCICVLEMIYPPPEYCQFSQSPQVDQNIIAVQKIDDLPSYVANRHLS